MAASSGRRVYVITPENRITAFEAAEPRAKKTGLSGDRPSVDPGVVRRFDLIRAIRALMTRLAQPRKF